MLRKPYPSDLSDAQWTILAPLIPPKIGRGKNRKVNLREIVNAIFYQLRQCNCLSKLIPWSIQD